MAMILSVYDHYLAHYHGACQDSIVGQLALNMARLAPQLLEYQVEAGPQHLCHLRPHPTDVSQQMVAISQGWALLANNLAKVTLS